MEHERQILRQTAKGVNVMPQERISDRIVEQCDEQFVSQFGEEIRVAQHVVAVPVPVFFFFERDTQPLKTRVTADCRARASA